jgi:hypothetical protein
VTVVTESNIGTILHTLEFCNQSDRIKFLEYIMSIDPNSFEGRGQEPRSTPQFRGCMHNNLSKPLYSGPAIGSLRRLFKEERDQ